MMPLVSHLVLLDYNIRSGRFIVQITAKSFAKILCISLHGECTHPVSKPLVQHHVTLTSDLLHSSCYDTMVIYRNMCLPGLVKLCQVVLEITHRKDFCD